MSQNGLPGELLLSKEKRERIPAWVLVTNFFNFNSTISQEVIERKVIIATFKSIIMPQDFKW